MNRLMDVINELMIFLEVCEECGRCCVCSVRVVWCVLCVLYIVGISYMLCVLSRKLVLLLFVSITVVVQNLSFI